MTVNLLWFRRDLRLNDNEIVAEAVKGNGSVLPFFIVDPWFYNHPNIGSARTRFLFESLLDLDASLRQCGSALYLFEGKSIAVLQALTCGLLEAGQRPRLLFNRDVQVEYGIDRDRAIARFYDELRLDCYRGNNHFHQFGFAARSLSKTLGSGRSLAAASLRAILDFFPTIGPFFTPLKGTMANDANFGGQVGFCMGFAARLSLFHADLYRLMAAWRRFSCGRCVCSC